MINAEDEIVEEVRVARESYAARFNYDLAAIYQDLKEKEQMTEHPVASLQPLEVHLHGVRSGTGDE
jgi:hypothetical protein